MTLPLLAGDVGELLFKAANDELQQLNVEFEDAHALTVVLASEGYPKSAVKGRTILGADILDSNVTWVSHAERRSMTMAN